MIKTVHSEQKLIIPRHVGIILDGNGRWAQARGLPRSAGHHAGLQTARRTIGVCVDLGIQVLTLYVFSTENWKRPDEEVNYLMRLAEEYATNELPELQQNEVRLQLMGRREGIPNNVLDVLDRTIKETRGNSRLTLNLAFNYGGRTEMVDAVRIILTEYERGVFTNTDLNENIITRYLYCPDCPDVDLVIRTSGEWRLSNFLLWRSANAVFYSMPVLWPDFQREDLLEAISIFNRQVSEQNAEF